jgi:hypothetical protein
MRERENGERERERERENILTMNSSRMNFDRLSWTFQNHGVYEVPWSMKFEA